MPVPALGYHVALMRRLSCNYMRLQPCHDDKEWSVRSQRAKRRSES